jgi:hypothetical protein
MRRPSSCTCRYKWTFPCPPSPELTCRTVAARPSVKRALYAVLRHPVDISVSFSLSSPSLHLKSTTRATKWRKGGGRRCPDTRRRGSNVGGWAGLRRRSGRRCASEPGGDGDWGGGAGVERRRRSRTEVGEEVRMGEGLSGPPAGVPSK